MDDNSEIFWVLSLSFIGPFFVLFILLSCIKEDGASRRAPPVPPGGNWTSFLPPGSQDQGPSTDLPRTQAAEATAETIQGMQALPLDARSALATVPYSAVTSRDKDCAICLQEYGEADEVYFLPCIHHFHVDCANHWFDSHSTCPTCRLSLTRNPQALEQQQGGHSAVTPAEHRPSTQAELTVPGYGALQGETGGVLPSCVPHASDWLQNTTTEGTTPEVVPGSALEQAAAVTIQTSDGPLLLDVRNSLAAGP